MNANRALGSPDNLRGVVLVVAGMLMLGFADNFVRVVAEATSVWQFHVVRGLMALLMIVAAARVSGGALAARSVVAVGTRTLLLVASMMIYFATLPMLPIAVVAVGLFTSPFWILIIAALVYRDPIGPRRIAAVAVGLVGAALIIDLDLADISVLAFAPVFAGFLYAASQVMTRRYCAEESTLALLAYTYGAYVVAGAFGAAALAIWPPAEEARAAAPFLLNGWGAMDAVYLGWLGFFAVTSVGAVGLVVRAYQIGDPTYLGVFEYAFLISAAATAYVVWDEPVTPGMALGGLMIIGAGAYLSRRTGRTAALRQGLEPVTAGTPPAPPAAAPRSPCTDPR